MVATHYPSVQLGYSLSCEEHRPADLVRFARRAEEVGFTHAMISDHFHPWIDRQGNSPFVWSVLGGIAEATQRLHVATSVTCPILRYHPALIAHSAATIASMMPGRFMLGVGTGENLNEHIFGQHWPPYRQRAEMLQEAVGLIRQLWTGRLTTHYGKHYTVENARLYTLPDELPPIGVAAGGPHAAVLAGELGDALINFTPDPDVVKGFEEAGGRGKPRYVQLNVCWAEDEAEARRTAYEICPNVALKGELGQQLPDPKHFEQAVTMLSEDDVAEVIVCGPDPDRHLDAINKCVEAGYERVHVYQVGSDQEGFFEFYAREILPRLHQTRSATLAAN
jgi:coenzyme F420-dependent glucose-6-phosphate dehydrogenase